MKVTPIISDQDPRDQLSRDRKINTLVNITRQLENQTQYDKDLTLTETRQNTYTTDVNNNTNRTTDPQISRAANNIINGEPTNPPKRKTAK